MQIGGLHHVTAVTGAAAANLAFYTGVLGLRLVKKTVNQDDWSAYHLFYADELGSPGTELTFFDWPAAGPNQPGVGTVAETALRVKGGRAVLARWQRHFTAKGVRHAQRIDEEPEGGVSLGFQDGEGQALRLISSAAPASESWPAPVAGLAAVTLTVAALPPTLRLLTEVLGLIIASQDAGRVTCQCADPAQRVHMIVPAGRQAGFTGAGGVHHVAFRAQDAAEQFAWRERLVAARVGVSEVIDRFYFRSIYFREPGGTLFEIATDGPGFAVDEDPARLGEGLSLPPLLAPHRARIEKGLQPLPAASRFSGDADP